MAALLAISSGLTTGCGDSPTVEVSGVVSAESDTIMALELSAASADAQGVDSLRLLADTAALQEEIAAAAIAEQTVVLRGQIETDPTPTLLVVEVVPLDRFDYIPGTIPSLPEE